jgi:hypothetical protein
MNNNLKQKGLETWLKWWSACLPAQNFEFKPSIAKKQKQKCFWHPEC